MPEKTMGSKIPFLLSLLFTAHLQGASEAQPIPRAELADFKDLLERFENKLELAEREGLEQDQNEANDEPAGDAAQPLSSWDGEYPRPQSEGSNARLNWQYPEKHQQLCGTNWGPFQWAPQVIQLLRTTAGQNRGSERTWMQEKPLLKLSGRYLITHLTPKAFLFR